MSNATGLDKRGSHPHTSSTMNGESTQRFLPDGFSTVESIIVITIIPR